MGQGDPFQPAARTEDYGDSGRGPVLRSLDVHRLNKSVGYACSTDVRQPPISRWPPLLFLRARHALSSFSSPARDEGSIQSFISTVRLYIGAVTRSRTSCSLIATILVLYF